MSWLSSIFTWLRRGVEIGASACRALPRIAHAGAALVDGIFDEGSPVCRAVRRAVDWVERSSSTLLGHLERIESLLLELELALAGLRMAFV